MMVDGLHHHHSGEDDLLWPILLSRVTPHAELVHLAVALHALKNRVPGTLVRARLCRRSEGLVYVLTVLGHDGKVARVVVDAIKGTLVGGL